MITYRTERGEELKKIANENNISLSQLSSDIIEDYLEFRTLNKHYRMYRDSEALISYVYEFLDDSALEKISDFASTEAINSIQMMTNDFSIMSILKIIEDWFKFNDMPIQIFSEESNLKLISNNNMSKNWNFLACKGFVKVFEHFGYSGMTDHFNKGIFSIKISTIKNQ